VTTDAGTSKLSFSAAVTVPSEGQRKEAKLTGEGEFDYEARRGRLRYELGDLLEAEGQPGNGEAEVVFDRTVFYLRFPMLAGSLPDGKEWVRLDLRKLGDMQGIDLAQLSQLNQDPSQLLDYLRATSSEIEEVGEEEVRGDSAVRYRARIDLDKVPEQVPEDVRAAVRVSVDALKRQLGSSSLPVDVWIDGEGRVRRFRQAIAAPGSDVELTMEFYDFGADVDVEPPPEHATVDLAELLEGDR
ncbi:MAG: hypothetical protein M3304_01035, partial [Actinomycetota bacterium]|nr:hypothetical protein [Actinomycetota bacterium]